MALLRRYRLLRLIAFAAFAGVVYGPLAGVLAACGNDAFASLAEVLSARRVELLLRSLVFSLGVATFTTLVGLLAALAVLRHGPRRAVRLQWLLLASVALPPTVYALAWSQFFALLPQRIVGHELQAMLAQSMALLPFATGVAMFAVRTSDRLLLDAARVLVSPARLLFGVAVPLARPMLLSGATLVFLLSLLDYTIPSIFGVNLYSLEIFVVFSATHRVADAFSLSLPLLACALLLLATLSGLPRRLAQDAESGFPRDGALPLLLQWAVVLAALLAGAALLAPLLAFLPALGDAAYLQRTIRSSWNETSYTLVTSVAAALIALLLAVGPALEMARGGRRGRMLGTVCLLPFLLPPALTGIGLIALWSPLERLTLYGGPGMSVAAELARFTPVAIVVLATSFLRTDPALVDAALVSGSSLWRIVTGVLLPLATPGLAAAAGIVFVLSLGEIGANLLVTPPGSATLSMKTYNYLHYGGSPAAAGLCLLLVLLAALGAGLPALAVRLTSKLRRS